MLPIQSSSGVGQSNPSLSKAEIERRRRARMNAYLNQLKMFHLMRSPNNSSKMEKLEVLDLTIKYLKSLGNNQRKDAERTAFAGYRSGFDVARQAANTFIYHWFDSSISAPLVAAVNASLASTFDNAYKSLHWLRPVYGKIDNRTDHSTLLPTTTAITEAAATTVTASEGAKSNQSEHPRSFRQQIHSTPIHCFRNIPSIFESPESENSSGSLSLSLSSDTCQNTSANSSSNDNNVCVTCLEKCCCK